MTELARASGFIRGLREALAIAETLAEEVKSNKGNDDSPAGE